MKANFFRTVFSMALLTVFLVACGADKDKKSSSSGNPSLNNYSWPSNGNGYNSVGSANQQQAFSNFANWYNSTTENSGSRTGFTGGSIVLQTSYMQNSNCQNNNFFIFNITTCSGSTSSSQNGGLSTLQITYVQNGQSKNQGRMAGFNFNTGSTPYGQMVGIQQYNNVFYITVSRNNRNDTVVVDTSYNSAVNPVVISNSAAGTVQQVVGVN